MESKITEVYITSPSKWMVVDQESCQPSKLDMDFKTHHFNLVYTIEEREQLLR